MYKIIRILTLLLIILIILWMTQKFDTESLILTAITLTSSIIVAEELIPMDIETTYF